MKRQHFSDTPLQTTMPLLQHGIIAMRIHGVVHTNVPHLVVHHSPTGFDVGYAGSGPADLALNILEWQLQRTHFQGPRLPCWEGTYFRAAWAMHQPFTQDFLAHDRHVIRVSLHTLGAWIAHSTRSHEHAGDAAGSHSSLGCGGLTPRTAPRLVTTIIRTIPLRGGEPLETFRTERSGTMRFWAVRDATDTLVCRCVSTRGAQAVTQRVQALDDA